MPEPVAIHSDEFVGKDDGQIAALREFKTKEEISREFARSIFQEGIRMYRLFAGVMPPEIESTFSQVMLWYPHAIIDEELPISMRAWLTQKAWLTLDAQNYALEPTRDTAEKWLINEMETIQQFSKTVTPSIQSNYIFGNGFRFYGHSFTEETSVVRVPKPGLMGIVTENDFIDEERTVARSLISGQYTNFFNVMPSPNGGMINPPSNTMESGLDWLFVNLYPPKELIEAEVEKGVFDGREAGKMFDENRGTDTDDDPTNEYKDELLEVDGGWNQFQAPFWVEKMKSEMFGDARHRITYLFKRKEWIIMGDGIHVLYNGPPLLPVWPVANFKSMPNLDSFYGISLLKVVEDLLISIILNFNMKLDYAAGVFHPPTYIPQKMIDDVGGDKSAFDWEPYKIIPYQHKQFPGGMDNYIFHDVTPPLDPTAALAHVEMKGFLEDIISQHGNQALSGETATVGSALLSKDVARSMMRAIQLDMTGVHDSAMLTLHLGAKYKNEMETINTGAEGMPWEKIDHDAITTGYGISINGARHMAQAEETFKRQLSIAPLFLNNPEIRGQMELSKQLLKGAGFDNEEVILHGEPKRDPALESRQAQKLPGGIPTSQNESRSVANRTGVPEPAGAMSLASPGAI